MRLPLEGVRVVDLSMWWAGPFATMELAGLGAEIIKVEAIQRVDGYRGGYAAVGQRAWEKTPTFLAFNLGKLDVTLDLSRPEGTALVMGLARAADVVINNYSARVMDNFGLGYPVLRKENPSIIMVSMPGFGADGPWRDYTGFAFNLEQLSGLAYHTGFPDGPPCNLGAAADPIMGMYSAFAVMTALEHRRRTGQGQEVDLAHLEALTAFAAGPVLDYQLNGRVAARAGNLDLAAAPHNFYPCRGQDQWVAISVSGDDEWRRLVKALGGPAWAADPRFADQMGRWKLQEQLDARIAQWTRDKDKKDVMRICQEAGVAAGAALDGHDLLSDPHLAARRFYQRIDRTEAGPQPYPRLPFLVDDEPVPWKSPAPTLGQHNRQVLGGLLGMTEAELSDLERAQVIGTLPIGAAPVA